MTQPTLTQREEFIKGLPKCELKAKIFELSPAEAKQRIKVDLEKGKDRSKVPDEIVDKMYEKFKESVAKLEQQGFEIMED